MELYDKIIPIRPPFEIEYIASSIVMEEKAINNIETIANRLAFLIVIKVMQKSRKKIDTIERHSVDKRVDKTKRAY